MNNVFGHYAVEVTNAAGQKTGEKVLYKDAAQKVHAGSLLAAKPSLDNSSPSLLASSLSPLVIFVSVITTSSL